MCSRHLNAIPLERIVEAMRERWSALSARCNWTDREHNAFRMMVRKGCSAATWKLTPAAHSSSDARPKTANTTHFEGGFQKDAIAAVTWIFFVGRSESARGSLIYEREAFGIISVPQGQLREKESSNSLLEIVFDSGGFPKDLLPPPGNVFLMSCSPTTFEFSYAGPCVAPYRLEQRLT